MLFVVSPCTLCYWIFLFATDLTDTPHISLETSYVAGEGVAVNQDVAGVESEEEEDDTEESRGDRFKTERTTVVSLKAPNKSYGNIPDSLGMLYWGLLAVKCGEGHIDAEQFDTVVWHLGFVLKSCPVIILLNEGTIQPFMSKIFYYIFKIKYYYSLTHLSVQCH